MRHSILKTILIVGVCLSASAVPSKADDKGDVKAEHGQIGNAKRRTLLDNKHPGAQWFPDAGLGLFLHWSICSVREMNISWPMIPGRKLALKTINDPKEIERIMREMDYELDGSKPVITPLEYWKMAETFNPDHYHPEAWLQKAKDAGFTYVVMTTKHHRHLSGRHGKTRQRHPPERRQADRIHLQRWPRDHSHSQGQSG